MPCKDCTDRHIGCHSKCEKYQAFRKQRDKENRERLIAKAIADSYYSTPRKHKRNYQ